MIDRQSMRRAPRTPHAGAAAEAAGVLALEAFDAGAALVDLTHQRLLRKWQAMEWEDRT